MSRRERILFWPLAAAALIACALHASRLPAAPLSDMQAASIYALAWGQYGGARPESTPEIRIVTQEQLRELVGCERCSVRGFHRQGVIYLDSQIDFSNPYDASILLHEAIHYLQWVAKGDPRDCGEWLAREHQAYGIQAQVLSKAGLNSMNVLEGLRRIACRD